MRKEWIKNSFWVEGTEMFDMGDEFVFFSKNNKGEDVEHHVAKKIPFPTGKDTEEKDMERVQRASVVFPDLPIGQALKELDKRDKKQIGV